MKYLNILFVVVFCLANSVYSQTPLTPGDIVVIGFKTNNNQDGGNDAIKLLNLVDLQCGTSFIVTDNNWNSLSNNWACNDDEFAIEITCNTLIAAGSIFYIDVNSAGAVANCSGGAVVRIELNNPWGTNYGLSSNGDNIYILQGNRASPNFIFAIKHNNTFSNTTCTNKDQAGLPSNLTLGVNAVVMASSKDQWHYNCVTNSGSKSTINTSICNSANWVSTSGQSWDNSSGIFSVTSANIQYGVLAVSGAGCGCLAGCNLAYSGGLNCTGVLGDCTAGYQNLSRNINVPSGCTYLVTAEMKTRNYGCSSSAADGNCQACDVVKVDELSGTKLFQQGGNNSDISDSYSLTGPGTIVVSGKANRADEIITYAIIATPCNCLLSILPLELLMFKANLENKEIVLEWMIQSEINLDYYSIERSQDALNWEQINVVKIFEPSSVSKNYKVFDSTPLNGTTYYRLKQVDLDGRVKYSKTETLESSQSFEINIFPNPNESGLLKIVQNKKNSLEIKLINSLGNLIYQKNSNDMYTEIDLSPFDKGIYVVYISSNSNFICNKITYQ
jgi:hypothetical protein